MARIIRVLSIFTMAAALTTFVAAAVAVSDTGSKPYVCGKKSDGQTSRPVYCGVGR